MQYTRVNLSVTTVALDSNKLLNYPNALAVVNKQKQNP